MAESREGIDVERARRRAVAEHLAKFLEGNQESVRRDLQAAVLDAREIAYKDGDPAAAAAFLFPAVRGALFFRVGANIDEFMKGLPGVCCLVEAETGSRPSYSLRKSRAWALRESNLSPSDCVRKWRILAKVHKLRRHRMDLYDTAELIALRGKETRGKFAIRLTSFCDAKGISVDTVERIEETGRMSKRSHKVYAAYCTAHGKPIPEKIPAPTA